jgi:hypothetical protein
VAPSVSLYVPCYNGAPWLADCLGALLGQTRPADEILVVDDGSTDESAAIAGGFAPGVRLVSHPRNLGLAVARNTALAAARGEIVASVDADVRVASTWLSRLLGAFCSPRIAAAGGRLREAYQERLADRWRAAHMAQHAGDFPLQNPPVLPGANVAVGRDAVRAIGGYDETFRTNYEDADLQHRLLAAGYLCRYEPGAVAYHLRTDTAASVLRTYWGWLRPPFERQGAFRDRAGLVAKAKANAGFAGRALWQDLGGGEPQLAYLSLLVLLAFPGADLAHAARRAAEGGDSPRAAALAGAAAAWVRRIPETLRPRSPALAASVGADLARLAWWAVGPSPGPPGQTPPPGDSGQQTTGDVEPLLAEVWTAVAGLSRAWWPAIERARERLAVEEGWPIEARGPRSEVRGPRSMLPGGTTLDPGPSTLDLGPQLAGAAGPDALAVVLHGADGRGEDLPWAPFELLLVMRQALPPARVERLRAAVAGRLRGREANLDTVEAHRLGWMPPSLRQQSLLTGAVVLWGDEAVLGAIPSWPPGSLDPRLALAEVERAGADLVAGKARLAVSRSAGALLLARRAYTPWHAGREDVLRRVWPEAPRPGDVTAARFVERARELVVDWLFTWEGDGPGDAVVGRYRALREAARTEGGGAP